MDSVVFWLESPSIHQAPLIRKFGELADVPVYVVTSMGLSARRRSMGWDVPDFGSATVIISPTAQTRRDLEDDVGRSSLNVVSGLLTDPDVAGSTRRLLDYSAPVIFQTERWRDDRLRGRLRNAQYGFRISRIARHERVAILAMGRSGTSAVVRAGMDPRRVAEFAYFPDSPGVPTPQAPRSGGLYVGNYDENKNVVKLITAYRSVSVQEPLLTVGTGPLEARLRGVANQDARVTVGAPLPFAEVSAEMASARYLILPSTYDGWGAVVNEALLVGTPVICTTAVGASALIEVGGEFKGLIIEKPASSNMRGAIEEIYDRYDTGGVSNARIQAWAEKSLSSQAGAQYLYDIGQRITSGDPTSIGSIVAPWRRI